MWVGACVCVCGRCVCWPGCLVNTRVQCGGRGDRNRPSKTTPIKRLRSTTIERSINEDEKKEGVFFSKKNKGI